MRIKHNIFLSFLILYSLPILAQNKPTVMPTERQFNIQLATSYGHDSSGYWDIQSKSSFFKKTLNIQTAKFDELRNQKFSLIKSPENGFYEINVGGDANMRVSVDSNITKDCTPLKIVERNSKANQPFLFHHIGNGRFSIYDKYGRVLCLTSCSGSNGIVVVSPSVQMDRCTEWYLIDSQSKQKFNPHEKNSNQISQNVGVDNKEIMKLIVNGKENEIKEYFKTISAEELIKSDNGTIARTFGKLNTNDKVTHTIWILEEVKNRPFEVKQYVYAELIKIDYNKPTMVLRHLINNYFTNYNEKEVELVEKITALQRKMNK